MKIDAIIRTRRRTIALIVERDGSLVVRAPLRCSDAQIRSFVSQHEDWIRAKQARARTAGPRNLPKTFTDGEKFYFLGETYPLLIVEKAKNALALNGRFLLARRALPKAQAVFQAWYRNEAKQVLKGRVAFYASAMNLASPPISITSARTRWGSCSPSGKLNFTYRLVMAPMPIIDYVVVHELVHLRVRNHSRKFWQGVGEVIPDYKKRVKWLKFNAPLLRLD
jgi:predicted metal-dependent hydrolase